VNSLLTSPALEINLAWLYAAPAVGGALIILYGLAAAFEAPPVDRDLRQSQHCRGRRRLTMLLATTGIPLCRACRLLGADRLRARAAAVMGLVLGGNSLEMLASSLVWRVAELDPAGDPELYLRRHRDGALRHVECAG